MSTLFSFDIVNVLLALAIIVNAIFGMIVYSRDRKSISHRLFFILALSTSAWGLSMFLLRESYELKHVVSIALAHALFLSAAAIPTICMYFASAFPNKHFSLQWWQKYIAPIFIIATSLIILTPGVFIKDVQFSLNMEPTIITDGYLHNLYSIYILVFFLLSYIILLRRAFLETDKLLKTRLIYVFLGTLIPAVVGIITNLVLPLFGISEYNWVGPVIAVLLSGILMYSILKHHLFDVRVITTQILMFVLWVITFTQILTRETVSGVFVSTLVFVFTVFVGLLLVQSMIKEVKSREQLETLTVKLKEANKRLKKLDQLKTEFLSIATHQLRTPLTSIKGYLSMVLEGGYGKVPEKANKVLQNIFNSSSLMAETITDFMNVSRIELGHIEYNMKNFNCSKLIDEIIDELKPKAEEARLKLNLEHNCADNETPVVHGDYGKVKYIFSNLVENAIKYTPEGSVTVIGNIDKKRKTVRVTIKDTGIGIAKNELKELFSKFKRARNAHNINIKGAGLGLYVAREIAKAHNGRIWVESEGEGKGSEFIVELPLVRIEKTAK